MIRWVDFIRRILPDLVSLGRVLYERFDGDTTVARQAIGKIRDHWSNVDNARTEIDRELDAMDARDAQKRGGA